MEDNSNNLLDDSNDLPGGFGNPDNLKANAQTSGAVADFEDFDESSNRGQGSLDKLEFLQDLHLNLYIELGRTRMKIKDILELERGYVIELDKLASEPVDIFVNNKKIAEGEVVVIDKHFGIRITNLDSSQELLSGLEK
ncbi:MAG: flagellar motor switch protein FliN [Ignavibacteriae bacterium HGW-Ignavibacteriae-2]|jgi:flagellar motor switch protein FliN/FliY|nr:flagellar motor switch protein FliN [Bacteroidota bacterium]PKL89264.1 MAG: flagellar motor switch protein FliN [Ignavibacteriae bacterium HGW-Ignavibacteriae-2]